MRRRWWAVAAAVVAGALVVAGLVVGGRIAWDRTHRSDFERALASVPEGAARISFTDWSAVRRTLHLPSTPDPSRSAVQRLMAKAYDRDFSAASSLNAAAPAVQESFGFSPGNADWEAYAQSTEGAAMVLHLPDDVSFDDLADGLRGLGYAAPDRPTGVWHGGPDLIASIDPLLSPELGYVALLPDRHLVVTSDSAGYAARAAAAAGGDADTAEDLDATAQMASRVGEPASAVVWARDFACRDLAMSKADQADQAEAARLIRQAGQVSPLSGLVMAMGTDRDLTVAEQFESSDQASENLRARATLAVGPAIGRGSGTFAEQFKLTSAKAVGSTVLLVLHPRRSTSFVLSALYDGPVLFATC